MDETKGPLSGKEPTAWQGPKRKAPAVYIGERVGKHRTVYLDTARNSDGSLPGIRNKLSRRIVRAAFKRSHSRVEMRVRNARALLAQAHDVARDNKKSTRWARRLFDKELSIHPPVYAPDKKTLRAMRTMERKAKRSGKSIGIINDAISAVVDRQAK